MFCFICRQILQGKCYNEMIKSYVTNYFKNALIHSQINTDMFKYLFSFSHIINVIISIIGSTRVILLSIFICRFTISVILLQGPYATTILRSFLT